MSIAPATYSMLADLIGYLCAIAASHAPEPAQSRLRLPAMFNPVCICFDNRFCQFKRQAASIILN